VSSHEQQYGEIPWRIKEDAGFPANYYELSYEQRVLVDLLLDKSVEMSDTINKLEEEIAITDKLIDKLEGKIFDLENQLEKKSD
tara:strand:- start:537 stop:788 length:252 start_codon:yes stop_codon:yes gene_type:complete